MFEPLGTGRILIARNWANNVDAVFFRITTSDIIVKSAPWRIYKE